MTLKNALVSAIPPMPDPEDRVGEVRRRARRSRGRLIGGAAAGLTVLAVTVGVSTLVKAPPPSTIGAPATPSNVNIVSHDCPASQPEYPWQMHDPASPPPQVGPMVPEADAISVTLCVKPMDADAKPVKSILLTADVGAILAELNGFPAPKRAENFRCTQAGFPYESLVIGYRDRTSMTVYTERNCGGAWNGARGRQLSGTFIDEIKRRYDAELIAKTPLESIKDQACATSLQQSVRDDLRWRRSFSSPRFQRFPNPLVTVTACRYKDNMLIGSHVERNGLGEVLTLLNAVPESSGINKCSTSLDVILAVDRTNAVIETRLSVNPCSSYMDEQELIALLKSWLG